jgi:tetratricopeptide (TPR) repeat protein
MKGDLTGALDDYNRAIEIDPKHSLAYLNRALIHYDVRDFRAAIDDFQRAIEISPNAEWFRLFVWLAKCTSDKGNGQIGGWRITSALSRNNLTLILIHL